jgi:uncharacterized protein YecE (DUF72 family)
MARGHCHVGTSGWNYKHWAGGRFYPPGLKPGGWLRFLADRFDTVEVNYSFYRVPSPKAVAGWAAAVPSSFRFAMKLWRGITHYHKLENSSELLPPFLSAAGEIPSRQRAPLLVQLPPQMRINLQRLDEFLTDLSRQNRQSPWRAAVEFRHPSWLVDPLYRLLDRHGAALVLADSSRCLVWQPNNVDLVYIRRHGGSSHPEGRYLPRQIAEDAERIRDWLAEGKEVYVYYNNDRGGHAVDNARELKESSVGG